MKSKYKIAVVHYKPFEESGGAFTFHESIFKALKNIPQDNFEFSFYNTEQATANNFLRNFLKKTLKIFSLAISKTGVHNTDRKIISTYRNYINTLNGTNWNPHFINSQIIADKCHFAYFTTPLQVKLSIPYITTHWDLAHRRWPIFPEVSITGDLWESREAYHRSFTMRAAKIITGTVTGKNELVHAYGIHPELITVNPFPVPDWINNTIPCQPTGFSYDNKEPFFLYPAQFWPHKNHILILKALKLLKQQNICPKFVFTGSDMGNLHYIKQKINEYGLEKQIVLAGFVKMEELLWYYQNTCLMVFPCIFGPDNLPPLEALASQANIAVADIPGARDYLPQDKVNFFNPTNKQELASLLQKFMCNSSKPEPTKLPSTDEYVQNLLETFKEISMMRSCWGHEYKHN